jgi:AAA+ superfamily predicted ATPase
MFSKTLFFALIISSSAAYSMNNTQQKTKQSPQPTHKIDDCVDESELPKQRSQPTNQAIPVNLSTQESKTDFDEKAQWALDQEQLEADTDMALRLSALNESFTNGDAKRAQDADSGTGLGLNANVPSAMEHENDLSDIKKAEAMTRAEEENSFGLSEPSNLDNHSSSSTLTNNQEHKRSSDLLADTQPIADTLVQSAIINSPKEIKKMVKLLKNKDNLKSGFLFKQWLIIGESGTGKTTLCKAIAAECNLPFFIYNSAIITNENQNSDVTKKLTKIFSDAASLNEPVIVIIEEIETLLALHNNSSNSHSTSIALCTLLDKYKDLPIIFIGTLSDITNIPIPIKSRFTASTIALTLPDEQQRWNYIHYYIVLHQVRSLKCISVRYEGNIDSILAQKTIGFKPRDLENLVKIALGKALERERNNNIELTPDDLLIGLDVIKKNSAHLCNQTAFQKLSNFIKGWIL